MIEAAAAALMDLPRQSTDIARCINNVGPGQEDGMDGLLGNCWFLSPLLDSIDSLHIAQDIANYQ